MIKLFLVRCLKFSQFFIIPILALVATSCGQKANKMFDQDSWDRAVSNMLIETSCERNSTAHTKIYDQIMSFSKEVYRENRLLAGDIFKVSFYDFINPMVINESILKSMLLELELHYQTNTLTIDELNKLIEYANRFEGMKCNFSDLKNKYKNDLRPYLETLHECLKIDNTKGCTPDILKIISDVHRPSDEYNTLKMCQALEDNNKCIREVDLAKKRNNLSLVTSKYLERFNGEKVETLFKLNSKHNKFKCQKNDSNIVMQIDAFNNGFDHEVFLAILNYIENAWGKNGLAIHFTEVLSPVKNSLEIKAIATGISHVDSNRPNTIFLDKNLDNFLIAKVAAHEFGHILGFPDCYIEFYSEKNNELVYYELSRENKNIMCSLKFGAFVQDSYIEQIKESSCNF